MKRKPIKFLFVTLILSISCFTSNVFSLSKENLETLEKVRRANEWERNVEAGKNKNYVGCPTPTGQLWLHIESVRTNCDSLRSNPYFC